MALRAGLDEEVTVRIPIGQRILRFDVALVHHGGGVFALHHQVRRSEALLDVAFLVDDVLRDVARVVPKFAASVGAQIVQDDLRVRAHGRAHVQDWRQHLVFHFDQVQRRFRLVDRGRRHRGQRLTFVGHPVVRQQPLTLR